MAQSYPSPSRPEMKDSFRDFVLDQLRGLGPVLCRPMFGGHGLYSGDRFFGILYKGRVFFKVSDATKGSYIESGTGPFAPSKSMTLTSFYEVPTDILESPPRMVDWARDAVKVANVRSAKKSTASASMTPEHILTGHTPAVRSLAEKLRSLIKSTVPVAQERAYPGWHAIGFRHPKAGYFCGIFPFEKEVKLYFEHGARLPDPDGILEGGQRQVRLLLVRRSADIPAPALRRLLLAAVALKDA